VKANAEALKEGTRLLSAYHLKDGTKILDHHRVGQERDYLFVAGGILRLNLGLMYHVESGGTNMADTAQSLGERVRKEVGFSLFSPTVPGFAGVNISAGVTFVCGPDGNVIRKATPEDIKKWNEAWNRIAAEMFKESQS